MVCTPKTDTPHILLVNPWIHDFAAYDFWAKPYGLLSLAALLRLHGIRVSYIDCLDRFHPMARPVDPHARHGRGPYLKTPIARPAGLQNIRRTYSRYGILTQWLRQDLKSLQPPDLILVTSMMAYWYPGVFETIRTIKEIFPQTPLILGGIYARLWRDHARAHSKADLVVTDKGESLFELIEAFTGFAAHPQLDYNDLDSLPYPAFDLQHCINYIPLLTAIGCPFNCAYCASHFLEPQMRRRTPQSMVEEILYWYKTHQVVDFAFYDDALLLDAHNHVLPMLEKIIQKQIKLFFHLPNAVHIRCITAEMADLMYRAGFHTLRLGLETTAFEKRTHLDAKVTEAEFKQAVHCLKSTGFRADQIGAYLLVGLPYQTIAAIQASIEVVKQAGITPVLAHYTPIPHTRLWQAAQAVSRYDLSTDPVLTNNAIFPCQRQDFSWQELSQLKKAARI